MLGSNKCCLSDIPFSISSRFVPALNLSWNTKNEYGGLHWLNQTGRLNDTGKNLLKREEKP
jgi:hypothetical protein